MCCKEMLVGELIQNEVVFANCSLIECVKGGWGKYVPCMHSMLTIISIQKNLCIIHAYGHK
jgi:hypothetical protein